MYSRSPPLSTTFSGSFRRGRPFGYALQQSNCSEAIRVIRVICGLEIRSAPALLSATLCAFTFYVAHPSRSILLSVFRISVYSCEFVVKRNRLDGELRRIDKENVTRKMTRLFLSGTLFGVIIAATFTYAFAIPANDYYWQMEIWNRSGAAWTYDKNGHFGWKWLVEPNPDTPRQKPISVPTYRINVRAEQR